MQVDIKPKKDIKGYFTIIPHGSIDSDTHDSFRQYLEPVLQTSTKGIVIDLKDVDYISSAGLGVFFFVQKYMKSCHGKLLFCHLKPQIKKLFDLMHALPPEDVFKNIEEADSYLYAAVNKEVEKRKKK